MVDRTAPLRPARPETARSTSPVRAHKNKPSQTEKTTASGNEHFRGSAVVIGAYASAARVVSAAQQAHKKRCTNPGQNVNRFAELPRRTRPPPDTTPADRPTPTMQTTTTWRPRMRLRVAQHSTAHVYHLRAQLGQSSPGPGCVPGHQRTPRKPPQMTWKKSNPPTSTYPSPRRTPDLHRRLPADALQRLEHAICRFPAYLPAEPPPLGSPLFPLFLGRPSPAPQHARGSKELCALRQSR
jgi:hypothetical protein